MARKVTARFNAKIELNDEKGGAWLATVVAERPDSYAGFDVSKSTNSIEPAIGVSEITAWKNASAAKRWVKSRVQAMTPRKSVKLNVVKLGGEKSKPVAFSGNLEFKVPYDFTFKK